LNKADILVTGVGGQGIVMATDILAEAALIAGCDVKKTDAVGMSQRGGSVISHVRLAGDRVFSPTISRGNADFLVAFERLEGLRCADFLQSGGVALIDDTAIPPLSVVQTGGHYPSLEEVKEIVSYITREVYVLPAVELATGLGNPRVASVLHLGALSVFLDLPAKAWLDGIKKYLPPKLHEINQRAFACGVETAAAQRKETKRC
jgi:indolepyruvate ferredoxin oxidoreductase beta subunit